MYGKKVSAPRKKSIANDAGFIVVSNQIESFFEMMMNKSCFLALEGFV